VCGFCRIEEGEAIVMLGGQDEIFGSCVVDQVDPGFRVKLCRCEVGEAVVVVPCWAEFSKTIVIEVRCVSGAVRGVPPDCFIMC
jgi:hypothetical protein